MEDQPVLSSESVVRDVLARPDLIPPSAGPSVGTGAVAKLRAEMARLSSGDKEHTDRRRSVESAIDRIDLDQLAEHASAEVVTMLATGPVSLEAVAAQVPTRALARSLGLVSGDSTAEGSADRGSADRGSADKELVAVADAVESVAGVIGRGKPVTAADDRKCAWLLERLAHHPDGPVAAVSMLYQNRDATAALLTETVAAAEAARGRGPAVSGTVRQATGPLSIGPVTLAAGDLVRLEFVSTAMEFGSGPHRCPGEAMASRMVEAIVDAINQVESLVRPS